MTQQLALATFGGGCFWCSEAIFKELNGVEKVVSGYSGGSIPYPTYEQVCSGKTGHAEAIQITFDPDIISYEILVEVFFTTHDPTTLNQQGNDVGTQYRSIIFYHDEKQKKIALKVKQKFEEEQIYQGNIVTEFSPFTTFYEAEKYHQDYYAKNSYQSYCQYVIEPKLATFRQKFAKLRKDQTHV